MPDTLSLPVLPLREAVIFPGVSSPIGAGRPGTLRAIQAAVAAPDRLIFAASAESMAFAMAHELMHFKRRDYLVCLLLLLLLRC